MSETLDPNDWTVLRELGHRMLDDAFDRMIGVSDRAVWRAPDASSRKALRQPLPKGPMELEDIYTDFVNHVAPFPTGNDHPRFFGWVMGNGTAEGMLADMLASAMNPHVGGYDQGATLVERQVLRWLKEIMGFSDDAGALLVSGGTMANLIGLMVARNAADSRIGSSGLSDARRLCVYGSSETHSWVEKAADILGLGREAMRRVAVDGDGRVEQAALIRAIAEDRAKGLTPFCVVGNAGTVDAGAIDDLDALADLSRKENLWFHIDGAFGSLLALSPRYRARLKGMERADSVAFDWHKWGFLQYELGCVLVRDAALQRGAFETSASYLAPNGRGIQPDVLEFSAMGPQLSRGFRALKLWMSLRHHGTSRLGQIIEQNVAQAQHLVARIHGCPELRLVGPAPLNIVCFRYEPDGKLPASALNEMNQEILLRIQESGVAVLSSTIRNDQFALRVAITNHRTTIRDMDVLVEAVLQHGRDLTG